MRPRRERFDSGRLAEHQSFQGYGRQSRAVRPPVTLVAVIRLDAATVLLQWSTGGMAFCWVTTATAWPASATAGCCGGSTSCSPPAQRWWGGDTGRSRCAAASVATAAACGLALAVSMQRRAAGVSGATAERAPHGACGGDDRHRSQAVATTVGSCRGAAEFPPVLDLVPVAFGAIGLIAAALDAAPDGGSDATIAVLRTLVGARSSAVSPARCCSATGISCSPACRADCSTSSSRCSAGSGRSRSPCCCSPRACSACGRAPSTTAGTARWDGSGAHARSRRSCS